MLIGVCSDKGSPGVTTTALSLASAWNGQAIVVEADPGGGDLAIRLRTRDGAALPEAPTVLTVAAAARTSRTPDLALRHAHRLTDDVQVISGHLTPEQSAGVVEWASLGSALAASQVPVFVDLGRLHAGSVVLPVAAMADVVAVVARPDPGSVIRLRERLRRLAPALAGQGGRPPRLLTVLVSLGRHGAADVEDLRRILADSPARPFLIGSSFVAFDPGAVARLECGEDPQGRLARTPLLRTARLVASELASLVGETSGLGATSSDPAGASGGVT